MLLLLPSPPPHTHARAVLLRCATHNHGRNPTQSYYGALLCCAWSPDGQYVAVGGEDDSLAIYSVAQRRCIVWGEGHGSWVAAVKWDADVPKGAASPHPAADSCADESPPPAGANGSASELYRVVSVGQDCRLGMWDVDTADEMMGPLAALQPVRSVTTCCVRVSSHHAALCTGFKLPCSAVYGFQITMRCARVELNGFICQLVAETSKHSQWSSLVNHSADKIRHRRGFGPSGSAADLASLGSQSPAGGSWGGGGTTAGGLSLPPSRQEMPVLAPVMMRRCVDGTCGAVDAYGALHRVHDEPLTDVLCTHDAVYTACGRGQIKCWRRPR